MVKLWLSFMLLFSCAEIDIERCVQDSIKIFCNTPKSATYRQHNRTNKPRGKMENRANLSYYSRDYHEQPQNDLVSLWKACFASEPNCPRNQNQQYLMLEISA